MKTTSLSLMLGLGLLSAAPEAWSQPTFGTAFTYQGRILQSGTAVTGVVDLQFTLWDALTGPTQISSAIPLSNVTCSNGLFTVTLDFGVGAFNGSKRWLEIQVSPDFPTTAYTTLTPRQELTPGAYAIYSEAAYSATNAVNATTATTATTANNSLNLGGVPPSGYALAAHTQAGGTITGIGIGQVVYGSAGGTLTTEAGFNYDEALNNLAVANDLSVGNVYKIGANPVLRVNPPLTNTFAGLSGNATATGAGNTALGNTALPLVTTGFDNLAVGPSSLAAVTVEDSNTAVGARALTANARAGGDPVYFSTSNTAVGANALKANTKGYANVAVGAGTLGLNTTGAYNTAVGAAALANAAVAGTGNGQTALGFFALTAATSANDNTAIGAWALSSNQTGNANTAVGVNALKSVTVSDNVAVGDTSLGNTTTGNRNSALGTKTLFDNVIGSDNTAMGALALQKNKAGQNTGIGASALLNNVNGTSNTALGAYALEKALGGANTAVGEAALTGLNNALGAQNTAVGVQAGNALLSGDTNIFVGYQAGSALIGAEGKNILIGSPGVAGDQGFIRIGTSGVHSRAYIQGIATQPIGGAAVFVQANGQLGVAVSSGRFKESIRDMASDADLLLQLRPVTFRYRAGVLADGGSGSRPVQFGLIAEEVEAVNPDWVVRDSAGKVWSVRYDQVNAALLGLAQRQNTQIEELKTHLEDLAQRLARLEAAVGR